MQMCRIEIIYILTAALWWYIDYSPLSLLLYKQSFLSVVLKSVLDLLYCEAPQLL